MKKTSWNFYTTNEQGWDAMISACDSAKENIDLEQFIFRTDEIGQRFIDICAKKAKQGVKVRFLWDAAGSFSFFGSNIIEDLKSKNIELVFFQTLFPKFMKFHNYKSWYFRNHKRTLVIDNKIGFTGSICFSDEMKNWKDTVVMMDGPVVNDMKNEFERMWDRAIGKKYQTIEEMSGERDFKYIANYPLPKKHLLYKNIIKAIRDAKEHVYITTPYFIPTGHLFRVLRACAKRGINVKIILPESSDHPIVDLCSRSFFSSLLKAGVKIYLYKGEMIHSKTIVIDDNWSTVGTLNLDTASLMYNFEANIVSTNNLFAKELSVHFIKDLLLTEEVNYERWKNRYWVDVLPEFFARLLRYFL